MWGWLALSCCLLSVPLRAAKIITIDSNQVDTESEIQFEPASDWKRNCTAACTQLLDPTKLYQDTVIFVTHQPGSSQAINIYFTGVGISIYGVVPNTIPSTTTAISLRVSINGTFAQSFYHLPDNTTDIAYNVSMFSNLSLPLGDHWVAIEPLAINEDEPSSFIFDYYQYLIPDKNSPSQASPSQSSYPSDSPAPLQPAPSSPSTTSPSLASASSKKLSAGTIAGGIIGGLAVAIAAIVGLCIFRRRRAVKEHGAVPRQMRQSDRSHTVVEPFRNEAASPDTSTNHWSTGTGTDSSDPPFSSVSTGKTRLLGRVSVPEMEQTSHSPVVDPQQHDWTPFTPISVTNEHSRRGRTAGGSSQRSRSTDPETELEVRTRIATLEAEVRRLQTFVEEAPPVYYGRANEPSPAIPDDSP
ncbi:hypothetical protein BD410DRAFT_830774 [Rickenella mellea]|uniref:Mid2 domain-containing protein n=1 Tax=Rickenella mellea TaxID=50990 RepID=A0A4Y7PUT2_9AGAM|nr:hypothetical protein BD410DRAFT_830774 [Rickenella mellea]